MTSILSPKSRATDPLEGLADPSHLQGQITADLAQQLRTHDVSLTVGNTAAVLITAVMYRHTAPPTWLALWLVLQFASAVFHLWLGLRWLHHPLHAENAPKLLRVVTRTSVINGLLWMFGVLIFWPGSSDAERMLLVGFVFGITAAALHGLHAHLPAYFAMAIPCMASIFLAVGWHGGFDGGWGALVIWGVYLVLVTRFAWSLHRMLVDSVRQRHQVARLAHQLRIEKDRALNLSQSRSRFLAAASHDLRQPVHALSLFVGALKQNPTPAQSQLIVQHVGSAVDAMGAMFNALLDISKLDADLLQPDWRNVDLQALLERIAADHRAMAMAKGLDFHSDLGASAQQMVHTDPVLLERILHNLLSNAVRYTAQGTVAIKVRIRHGHAVVLVADTGVGIARSQREQAFEEFVQLSAAEHEREHGLGLGLSIVRRLASLLGIGLVLRSKPERGTVFSLHLPLAKDEATSVAQVPVPNTLAGVSGADDLGERGVVLVIDDSVEIQLAMRALLSGWGFEVFAAANVPALMPQVMALTQIPRLLLCDYRLSDGGNGIAAIAQLQESFNHDIPAILITGDTGPDRLREAVASGLPLLHKPVTQSRLRETIDKVLVGDDTIAV